MDIYNHCPLNILIFLDFDDIERGNNVHKLNMEFIVHRVSEAVASADYAVPNLMDAVFKAGLLLLVLV